MSTTQFDASHLARILLGGVVGSLTARGDLTPEQKEIRARGLWDVIATCEPRDAIQTMLIGQCLLFNEMIADGGRDVLVGMMDTLKLRAQSNLNGMSRSFHQNLAMLVQLRDKSAAAAATREELREVEAAAEQRLEAIKKASSLKVAAATPRQDKPVRSPENSPSDRPGIAPAVEIVAGASAPTNGNPAVPDAPALDPRPGTPVGRPVVEPVPPRPNEARVLELTGTA